jgi:UDP-N-acetylglucosamine acyltransferase
MSVKTSIGKNGLLMAYAHVAHDCIIGDNVIMANCVNLAGHVEIEDHAILEGGSCRAAICQNRRPCFYYRRSLVRKNVPPYVKASTRTIGYAGINAVGLRRRKFSADAIRIIEDTYRILFIRENNVSRALEMITERDSSLTRARQHHSVCSQLSKGIMKGLRADGSGGRGRR